MGSSRVSLVVLVAACGFQGGAGPTDANVDSSVDAPGTVSNFCEPLPPSTGTVVNTVGSLRTAVMGAANGATILVADGVYDLGGSPLTIGQPNVTLRSASGHREDVVIDSGGPDASAIKIAASNVTVTSLTIQHGTDALTVQPVAMPGIEDTRIYDVLFRDQTNAPVLIFPMALPGGPYADHGTIACSRFELTPTGGIDPCAFMTGIFGIDAVAALGWTVRDNWFVGLHCANAPKRTVAFDDGSRDTTIIRNRFLNSGKNIRLGNDPLSNTRRNYPGDALPDGCTITPDHWGGVVCNNTIAGLGVTQLVEGIALWHACDTKVVHNTIVSRAGATVTNIEYRFADTLVQITNNLSFLLPDSLAGGIASPLTGNFIYRSSADFVDAAAGDLRLASPEWREYGAMLDQGVCDTDANGNPRNLAMPVVGAYE